MQFNHRVFIFEDMEENSQRKIAPSDFFIESSFASRGKQYPCYLLTKKGCDMVANKMTGEKGVLFTAAYVTAFEQMREHIQSASPRVYPPKATSVGEIAQLLKVLRSTMKDNDQPPEAIAEMTKMICDQFGIALPPGFVKVDPFLQSAIMGVFWSGPLQFPEQ